MYPARLLRTISRRPVSETFLMTVAFSYAASGIAGSLGGMGFFRGEGGAVAALSLFVAACVLFGYWLRHRITPSAQDAVTGISLGVAFSFLLRSYAGELTDYPADLPLLLSIATANIGSIIVGFLYAASREA